MYYWPRRTDNTCASRPLQEAGRSLYEPSASLHPCQRCLHLGQPEGHGHGARQCYGSSECRAGLLPLTELRIQGAQATVAVRLQRTHTECLGQGESLLVVGRGEGGLWGGLLRRHFPEEPQGVGGVAPFLMGLREL